MCLSHILFVIADAKALCSILYSSGNIQILLGSVTLSWQKPQYLEGYVKKLEINDFLMLNLYKQNISEFFKNRTSCFESQIKKYFSQQSHLYRWRLIRNFTRFYISITFQTEPSQSESVIYSISPIRARYSKFGHLTLSILMKIKPSDLKR